MNDQEFIESQSKAICVIVRIECCLRHFHNQQTKLCFICTQKNGKGKHFPQTWPAETPSKRDGDLREWLNEQRSGLQRNETNRSRNVLAQLTRGWLMINTWSFLESHANGWQMVNALAANWCIGIIVVDCKRQKRKLWKFNSKAWRKIWWWRCQTAVAGIPGISSPYTRVGDSLYTTYNTSSCPSSALSSS